MPVIGLNIRALEAKKSEEVTGMVKVQSNMNITNVEKQDLAILNREGLSIEFNFKISYIDDKNKDIAEISIDGNVIFIGDEQEKVLKDWKKEKKVPEDVKFQVIRVVSDKCSKKAVELSDDLQLPPPPIIIPQPRKEK